MRAGARMESFTLDELLTRARSMLPRGQSGCSGLSEFVAAAGRVLSLAPGISKGISAYFDDILIDETIFSAHAVKKHLARSRWDEPICDERIRNHLAEIVSELKKNDPVHGQWDVSGSQAKIWVDASMLALSVALERRRIETVPALIKEYDLAVTVTLVQSSENKADRLTTVPKRWLASAEPVGEEKCITLQGTRECDVHCTSPAAVTQGYPNVTAEIAHQLESIFLERSAPDELLADNDLAFRSCEVAMLAERWGTCSPLQMCHAPSGNGITERSHRSVKVIAARTGCSGREAVYRYNLMPRDDRTPATALANAIYQYTVRDRNEMTISSTEQSANCPYRAGESIWVKPRGGRCDDRYESGIVTGLVSDQAAKCAEARKNLETAPSEGVLLPFSGCQCRIPLDVISEALILSDVFDMNEYSAVSLVMEAQRSLPNFLGISRGVCAVLLFFQRRWYCSEALRLLFLNCPGRRWECALPSLLFTVLKDFVDRLWRHDLLKNILDFVQNFLINDVVTQLESPSVRGIGTARYRKKLLELMSGTLTNLADCVFYYCCQSLGLYGTKMQIFDCLRQCRFEDDADSLRNKALLPLVLAGLELMDVSSLEDAGPATDFELLAFSMNTPESVRDLKDWICTKNWLDEDIRSVFLIAAPSTFSLLRQVPWLTKTLEDSVYDEDVFFDEAFSLKPFQFMRRKMLPAGLFRDEFFVRRFHSIIVEMITLFPLKIKELRMQFDEAVSDSDYNAIMSSADTDTRCHFRELLHTIRDFYSGNPLNLDLAKTFFCGNEQNVSVTTADILKTNIGLFKFIRTSAENMTSVLFCDYMAMLTSLACSSEASQRCFDALVAFSSYGSQLQNCTLRHLFHALDKYAVHIRRVEQSQGATEHGVKMEMSTTETAAIVSFLKLIRAMCDHNTVVREIIFSRTEWHCTDVLLQILSCSVSSDLAVAILDVFAAFAKTGSYAVSLCKFFSTNTKILSILGTYENVKVLQLERKVDPLTLGILNFINEAVRHEEAIYFLMEKMPSVFLFVFHTNLPRIRLEYFECLEDMVTCGSLVMEILYTTLRNVHSDSPTMRNQEALVMFVRSTISETELFSIVFYLLKSFATALENGIEFSADKATLKVVTAILKLVAYVTQNQMPAVRTSSPFLTEQDVSVASVLPYLAAKLCHQDFLLCLVTLISYAEEQPLLSVLAMIILGQLQHTEENRWITFLCLSAKDSLFTFANGLSADQAEIPTNFSNDIEIVSTKSVAELRGLLCWNILQFLNESLASVRMTGLLGQSHPTLSGHSNVALFLAGYDCRNPQNTTLEAVATPAAPRTVVHSVLDLLQASFEHSFDQIKFIGLIEPAYRFCEQLTALYATAVPILRRLRALDNFILAHMKALGVKIIQSDPSSHEVIYLMECMVHVMNMAAAEALHLFYEDRFGDTSDYFELLFDARIMTFDEGSSGTLLNALMVPALKVKLDTDFDLPHLVKEACTVMVPKGFLQCDCDRLLSLLQGEKAFALQVLGGSKVELFEKASCSLPRICVLDGMVLLGDRSNFGFRRPLQHLQLLLNLDACMDESAAALVSVVGLFPAYYRALHCDGDIALVDDINQMDSERSILIELDKSLRKIHSMLLEKIESLEARTSIKSRVYFYTSLLLVMNALNKGCVVSSMDINVDSHSLNGQSCSEPACAEIPSIMLTDTCDGLCINKVMSILYAINVLDMAGSMRPKLLSQLFSEGYLQHHVNMLPADDNLLLDVFSEKTFDVRPFYVHIARLALFLKIANSPDGGIEFVRLDLLSKLTSMKSYRYLYRFYDRIDKSKDISMAQLCRSVTFAVLQLCNRMLDVLDWQGRDAMEKLNIFLATNYSLLAHILQKAWHPIDLEQDLEIVQITLSVISRSYAKGALAIDAERFHGDVSAYVAYGLLFEIIPNYLTFPANVEDQDVQFRLLTILQETLAFCVEYTLGFDVQSPDMHSLFRLSCYHERQGHEIVQLVIRLVRECMDKITSVEATFAKGIKGDNKSGLASARLYKRRYTARKLSQGYLRTETFRLLKVIFCSALFFLRVYVERFVQIIAKIERLETMNRRDLAPGAETSLVNRTHLQVLKSELEILQKKTFASSLSRVSAICKVDDAQESDKAALSRFAVDSGSPSLNLQRIEGILRYSNCQPAYDGLNALCVSIDCQLQAQIDRRNTEAREIGAASVEKISHEETPGNLPNFLGYTKREFLVAENMVPYDN
ncbi:hypothetical protein M514_10174 [Trichuris suis]|uniref:Uncharacterized protein n=1 Tax=Trichuris suis TaxID=68888 RepID=A0A085NG82_9BILA|nr:hypothetical protein M514_10174 [Trichuris suis]